MKCMHNLSAIAKEIKVANFPKIWFNLNYLLAFEKIRLPQAERLLQEWNIQFWTSRVNNIH